jgi:hypothetical protein
MEQQRKQATDEPGVFCMTSVAAFFDFNYFFATTRTISNTLLE